MNTAGHDDGCRGCRTERELRAIGGAQVRDYIAYCDRCGRSIQGDYEHRIERKTYCRHCGVKVSAHQEE